MKKILCLFSALTLVLSSCSNDDNETSNAVLPKTIKFTSFEFPENTIATIIYNGNKLVSLTEDGGRTDYTYNGDLIVKEVSYDIESVAGKDIKSDETIYTYANGKLAESSFSEGFSDAFPNGEYKTRTVYTHNADGTVKVEKYNTNKGIEKKSNYIEVLTYSNGNLVKSVETNSEFNNVFTAEYEYDNKSNPLKNILGYSLLIGHSEGEGSMSSVNNTVKYTASYSVNIGVNTYKRELIYDANGYPTKISHYKNDGTTVSSINEYTY